MGPIAATWHTNLEGDCQAAHQEVAALPGPAAHHLGPWVGENWSLSSCGLHVVAWG